MEVGKPRFGRRPTSRRASGLIALGAAALLACASCTEPEPPPPAVLVDSVTFESGEVANVSLQTAADDALSVTDSVARAGDLAGLALLREDDEQFRGDLGYRSEWQSSFDAERDKEYWYGFSVYLPEDWDQGDNEDFFDDRIIFQFHEGTGSSPALSLHLDDGDDRFFIRRRTDDGFEYLWSMEFETERWYDFALNVVWSRDDDGLVRLYVGGEFIGEYEGETLVDGRLVYAKWGIYGQPTRIFLDEIRIAEGHENGLDIVSPD